MTHGPDEEPIIKGVEVVIDYDEVFADRLLTIQQLVYEFRAARGVKDDQPDIGAFAQHQDTKGGLSYTARSAHAGHIAIEYMGRSVTLDFSKPDITLEIVVDGQRSSIDANAPGISILTDIQRRFADLEVAALRLED